MSTDNSLLDTIKKVFNSRKLPAHDEFVALCNEVIDILENEDSSYRPREKLRKTEKSETAAPTQERLSGGLLDFRGELSKIPLVVVPDLHGRGEFIIDLLEHKFDFASGKTVFELLGENLIRIVCVGDIFHSERRGAERWYESYTEYIKGNFDSPSMREEMAENLNLLEILLLLKKNFTPNFHILKGNHENVLNENIRGNYSFRKFVEEGNMVLDFLRTVYDDVFVYVISCFEHSLPLCAIFDNAVISHAEPAVLVSKSRIIDYRKNPQTVIDLTWTSNGAAEVSSVKKSLKSLYGKIPEKIVWLGGHRPVAEKFALRQNGLYVQFHNPYEENVAVVLNGKQFSPEDDIVSVKNDENSAV